MLIKKIRNKINSGNTNKILKNVFSLFILQGSNYILPLVLLPYLIRTLGIEYFGLLAFATATVNILRGIVSYGFDLSATKEISQNSDNKEKLRELFNSVILAKFLLSILTLFLLIILVSYFDKFNVHYEIFLITFILVFGDILFPIWFFQGIEKMKFITYIRVGYKIIFVSLVLILVNNPEDFWLVPLIDGIGSILAGLFSLYIINKNHQIYFSTINFPKAINQLKEGWHIFISKFAVILYSTINTFLLGILSTNENVGYYSIVEKIYLALRGGLSPLTQAIFPYLSKIYKQNKYNFYKIVRKISIFYFILIFIISISMYFFSTHIIGLILGEYNYQTIEIFKIFSFTFFFSIGGLYSLLLIIKNQGSLLSKITMKLVIINIILVYPVIYYWNIFGLAYLFMFIQILQFIMQINYNKEFFSKKTYNIQKEKND